MAPLDGHNMHTNMSHNLYTFSWTGLYLIYEDVCRTDIYLSFDWPSRIPLGTGLIIVVLIISAHLILYTMSST